MSTPEPERSLSDADPTPETPVTRADIKGSITANTVIENPNVRRTITNVLGVAGLLLGTVMVVDIASPDFDLTAWTEPIFVGYAYLASAFGLVVTRPNTPKL